MSLEKLASMKVGDVGIHITYHVSPRRLLRQVEFPDGKPASKQPLSVLYDEFKNLVALHLEESQRYNTKDKIQIKDYFNNGDMKYVAYFNNEPAEI
jgi:hypothetical protein